MIYLSNIFLIFSAKHNEEVEEEEREEAKKEAHSHEEEEEDANNDEDKVSEHHKFTNKRTFRPKTNTDSDDSQSHESN